MFAGALLLALAAPQSDMTLVTPLGSGEVSIAVVEWQGGTWLNFRRFPPGPGVAEGQIDSLVEHRQTRVEIVLAGPRLPSRITLRRVYPEMAAMRIRPVRRLAVLERTGGGYWHDQWDTEARDGLFCLSRDAIKHFHIAIPGRSPNRNGEICLQV